METNFTFRARSPNILSCEYSEDTVLVFHLDGTYSRDWDHYD